MDFGDEVIIDFNIFEKLAIKEDINKAHFGEKTFVAMQQPIKISRPEFVTLSFDEKLQLLELECPKVAQFLTDPHLSQHITIYAVSSFFAELAFDLRKRKIASITSFDNIDYLNKHRSFMWEMESKIRNLNQNHPFQ